MAPEVSETIDEPPDQSKEGESKQDEIEETKDGEISMQQSLQKKKNKRKNKRKGQKKDEDDIFLDQILKEQRLLQSKAPKDQSLDQSESQKEQSLVPRMRPPQIHDGVWE